MMILPLFLMCWVLSAADTVDFISNHSDTCSVCDCNNNTREVNCSTRSLHHIPPDPTGNTVLLNMTHNKLHTITNSTFKSYTTLKVLDLTDTSLEWSNIAEHAFNSLSSLQVLNLSHNERLPFNNTNPKPIDMFKDLRLLKELKLFGNTAVYMYPDEQYPDEALAQLTSLDTLWIDGLNNATFGATFRNMTSLMTLYLTGDLTTIERFCVLPNLTQHILQHLIHVEKFWARRCRIRVVESNAFSKMAHLKELDLSNNHLLTIDQFTIACEGLSNTRLETLYLNSMQPTVNSCGIVSTNTLKQFGRLNHLKVLQLKHNEITGFEFGALKSAPTSVEYIDIGMNKLDIGMYAFETFYLLNLIKLDMAFNQLSDKSAIYHNKYYQTNDIRYSQVHSAEGNTAVLTTNNGTAVLTTNNGTAVLTTNNGTAVLTTNNGTAVLTTTNGSTPDCTGSTDEINPQQSTLANEFVKSAITNVLRHLYLSDDSEHHFDDVILEGNDDNSPEQDGSVCPRQVNIPPETITICLPTNLKYIDLSHSKMAHPIPSVYLHEDNNVISINASKALLYCWDGPVHGLIHLEYLDLSNNYCRRIRMTFFDFLTKLKSLNVANNILGLTIKRDVKGRLFRNLNNLEHLDISNNQIDVIPKRFLIHQQTLRTLNISCNLLISFDIEVDRLVSLRWLDLEENNINTLSEVLRNNISKIAKAGPTLGTDAVIFTLNLEDNLLRCFCNNMDFLHWVYGHMSSCRFLNISISKCIYYNNTIVKITTREKLGELLYDMSHVCETYITLIVASTVAFVVIVCSFTTILVYRFRWKMTYWYYVKTNDHSMFRRDSVSIESISSFRSRYKFDLYVSSVENIRLFVLENMKKILEDNAFRVFIQDDDIIPGQNIYSMIGNAIHVSRVVLFIVSESCTDSREWKIAMRMAHEESLNRGYPIFFGVFVGTNPDACDSKDIHEMKQRRYLTYPDSTQPLNEQTFWHDLVSNIKDIGGRQVLSIPEDDALLSETMATGSTVNLM